jgi:hypothetical protein
VIVGFPVAQISDVMGGQFGDFFFCFPKVFSILKIFRIDKHFDNFTVADKCLEDFLVKVLAVERVVVMFLVQGLFPIFQVDLVIDDIWWWHRIFILLYRPPQPSLLRQRVMRQINRVGLHLGWMQGHASRHLLVGQLVAGRPHERSSKLVLAEFVPERHESLIPAIAGRHDTVRVVLNRRQRAIP